MYHFVYKTINPLNGKYCFGKHSTNNLKDNYQGSGKWIRDCKKSKTKLITNIIRFTNTEKEAYDFEKIIVEKYFNDPKNMNMVSGGYGYQSGENHPHYNTPMPLEKRKKISLAQKGKPRWTNKQKKEIGKKHKGPKGYWYGKTLPDDIKQKISIANSGDNNGMKKYAYKVTGKNNGMYGKTHSIEKRKIMSEASKKYWAKKRLEKINESIKSAEVTPKKDDIED